MPAKKKEEEREFDLLDRLITLGLGAINLTRAKAEKLAKELEKKGEISKKDVKKTIDELVEKGKKEKEELQETIDERISEFTKKLGIITKADLEKITRKLERLEKKIK